MTRVQFLEMLIEEVEELETIDDVVELLNNMLDEIIDDEYINGPEEFQY